jgi:Flp pilus assembly pilin Flp
MSVWMRFWRDETGQDLVEYALLTMLIGFVGAAVWSGIVNLIGLRYTDYDTGVQSLWESP